MQSLLQTHIREYPYRRTLVSMRDQGLSAFPPTDFSANEAYREVMICTGATMRSESRDQRRKVLSVIRESTSLPSDILGDDEWFERSRHDDKSFKFAPTSATGSTMENSTLGRFASALQEYGIYHTFVPSYTVVQLSAIPSEFRATVSCGALVFDGVDRNKKQARHKAALKACEHFKIKT